MTRVMRINKIEQIAIMSRDDNPTQYIATFVVYGDDDNAKFDVLTIKDSNGANSDIFTAIMSYTYGNKGYNQDSGIRNPYILSVYIDEAPDPNGYVRQYINGFYIYGDP